MNHNLSSVPDAPASIETPMEITLFGPMQVRVAGQDIPRLRSRKALWLLALLALRHERPVDRHWLAETLWPDSYLDLGLANLRTVLSELRQALGGASSHLLSPNRRTLGLNLSEVEIDVVTFDAASASRSFVDLERAAALYRGQLLEGCSEEWIFPERAIREQSCLRTLQTLADKALSEDDCVKASEYSRRALALDPWSESARRGLMEALARGGDVNTALQIYRELIELLRGDPGGAPDPQTQSLYERLRSAAGRNAHASSSLAFAPLTLAPQKAVAVTISGSLPHPVTELIGREDDCLEVAAKLRRSRMVTLTGLGGVGKTRLAAAVAAGAVRDPACYADGVWLVALEALTDGSQLERQIADVFGVKEGSGPALMGRLIDHLRGKRLLLVLDNCEHLLDASAQAAARLLRECAGVRVLATSREALRVTGEVIWTVSTLAFPDPDHLPEGKASLARVIAGYDSVQLFVERAQASLQTFQLTGDCAHDVAHLCHRLEGLPLALELAAARVNVLTPAQILAQLDARPLDALTARSRDVAPRHRTLRAALEWSYGLLPAKAREHLLTLGVFRGGWTLEAARAVCPDTDAVEMLATLRDASLISVDAGSSYGRFFMLETVRQFALEALDNSRLVETVRRRHAEYYAHWVHENFRGWQEERAREFQPYFAIINREYANVSMALDWASASAEDELFVRLCSDLGFFWLQTGRSGEAREWLNTAALRAARIAAKVTESRLTGAAESELAHADYWTRYFGLKAAGDFEGAIEIALRDFEHHRLAGNPVAGRTSLFNAGSLFVFFDLDRAMALFEQCLELEREFSADGRANPVMLSSMALVAYLMGQYERSSALLDETLSLCVGDEERDPHGYLRAMLVAGHITLADQNYAPARDYLNRSAALARGLADAASESNALLALAALARDTGDLDYGKALVSEAVVAAGPEPGFRIVLAMRRQRAELLLAGGDIAAAVSLVGETLALLRGKARICRIITYAYLLLLADAERSAAQETMHFDRVSYLLGAALGVATRLGMRTLWRSDRDRAARLRVCLAERLGTDRQARQEAAGFDMDDEAALEFALATRIRANATL